MNTDNTSLTKLLIRRMNVKAVAMVTALFLVVTGSIMIVMGIRDNVAIDLSSAFLEGQVKSGLVGIALIFFAVVISVACITRKKAQHRIVVQRGDTKVEWEGALSSVEELDMIERFLGKQMEGRGAANKPVEAIHR